MRALVGRYFEPRQYFVEGDEVIDEMSVGRSAAPSLNFTRLSPDLSIDKRNAFLRPALRVPLGIFEGLVDVAVIEERGSVRDTISVVGIRDQAQKTAGHKGTVGEKRTLDVIVERSRMAKLRFLDLAVALPMSCPDRKLVMRGRSLLRRGAGSQSKQQRHAQRGRPHQDSFRYAHKFLSPVCTNAT